MTEPPTSERERLAELIRDRLIAAAEAAYDDAGIQGLCAEGRIEVAIGAMKNLDLRALLDDPSQNDR
jgi:hypothetical protein